MDVGPSGENLWLRNRIAEHELVLCIASSVAAGLLVGLRAKNTQGQTGRRKAGL
jgi:hypothetical protein